MNLKNINAFLFLLLGLFGFYVKIEPSYFEFFGILLLLLNFNKLKKIDIFLLIFIAILLNISNIYSYDFEVSLKYNSITIYIVSLAFLFNRISIQEIRQFTIGGVIGMLLTLLVAYLIPDTSEFWYYNRLMGGFKDPNVLAPTSLLTVIVFNFFQLKRKTKILVNILALVIIFLALSRAALFLTFLYYLYVAFSFNNKLRIMTISIFLLLVTLFSSNIESLYQESFSGRTDERRFSGQVEAFNRSTFLGNGATSSDYFVGHSPHNSFVRIISDNGFFPFITLFTMCFILLAHSKIDFETYYLLSLVFIISLVIDTLHWRCLFVFIGIILKINKIKHGEIHI